MSIGSQKNKKYARLCIAFKEQAECRSVEVADIWAQAELFPWIDSHPWSDRGIPKDFANAEFSVQADMREEFAAIAATYDKDDADANNKASVKYRDLLDKQAQTDMDYLLKHCSEEDQRRALFALNSFYEKHMGEASSPYLDTRALGTIFYMGRTIEMFLERGYQSVYGTRNF